jgi:hypothetical protein
MVLWEADAARILGQVRDAYRLGVADEDTEDAATDRLVSDRRARSVVYPGGQEPLEPLPRRIDHAERRVASVREPSGRLHDALEQRVERQLRAE